MANAIKCSMAEGFCCSLQWAYYFVTATSNLPSMKPAPSLAEVIASLPEEERVVLSLHYVKGMATAEIAQTLGVPQKAVSTVMEQGKKRLFQALDFPPLA